MPFDHIYLVNLPQHRGRLLRTLTHLDSYGITPEVFVASDGNVPPLLNKFNEYSSKELGDLNYFKSFKELEQNRNKKFIETAGAYGYIETYINILKDAKSKGYESILIFEDDVILSNDFNKQLDTFISKIPDTWKFLGLGASQYNWSSVDLKKAEKDGFYTPKQIDTCGSFAIAIKNDIYDELIELQSFYDAPFDLLALGEIYNRYSSESLIAFPFLVMPDVRNSSIRGSRNQLVHAMKMKWDPSFYNYPLKRLQINLILSSIEEIKYLESFSDETTFPFELHLFIPSLDGLRPYHHQAQSIEPFIENNKFKSPNKGICVQSKNNIPITEDSLVSLYESLVLNKGPTSEFIIINTIPQIVDIDRVSVIIPTYKRSENIKNVLLSVIEQNYENKEIILVDDNDQGSDHQLATEEVVNGLKQENPHVNLIYVSHTKNRNGAAARNTGFFSSTGNYICFLDDDDIYLPGRLTESIEKLKNTPSHIGAVYCGFNGWNGANNQAERYKEGNLTLELLSLDYLAHFLHTNTATYKREAVTTLGGFDETFIRHQDIEFNLRFFEYFDMGTVNKSLIHLKPKPTVTNNQQFGMALFETKIKFLRKFEYIINRYDASIRKEIYQIHWTEVVKYIQDQEKFKNDLSSDFSNGGLQCLLQMIETQKSKEVTKTVSELFISKPKVHNIEKKRVVIPKMKKINFWQRRGAILFGIVFGVFINPRHRQKLKDNPVAFFYDSKNSFTRFWGRLFKII